jgi:hypothetical protein
MRRGVRTWVFALAIAGCTSGGGGDGPDALTLGGASTDGTAGATEGDDTATVGGTSMTQGDDATSTQGTADDAPTDDDGSSGGDSTGGPPSMSCADDPAACDAWVLPPGAAAWEPITIGGPTALAPEGDVLAAFDIEAPEIAFVVTGSDVSILDLATRSWTSKRDFAATFPDVGGDPLRSAFSVPASMTDVDTESVTLGSSDTAYIYEYDIPSEAFTFVEATVFGAGWALPEAPMGADVRAMWVDIANAHAWIDPTTPTPCGVDIPIGPTLPVVAGANVHVMEAGACFEFFTPVSYTEFEPFSLPGAPDVELVGGALYSESRGLWIFRGA